MAADASTGRGAGRRRWAAAAVVIAVVVAGVMAAGIGGAFRGSGSPGAGAAGNAYHTSTATVTRRSLSSQTQVNATLGYAGSYTVAGNSGGILTWLPAAGRVIREGGVLYRVDNATPVFLLYGRVPAWRALAGGMTGKDVAQLNRDLVQLGYASSAALGPRPGWHYFSSETASALEQLQAHVGLPVTGTLPLGQAIFEPSAIRVTTVTAPLGSPASGTVLTGTSTTPVVTIALDAAQQTEVKAGDKVTITLPDGSTTPGVVASVGKVAKGSGSSATITVQVTLSHPKAAGHLDQAPVTVAITTATVTSALVVPVTALLARPAGGYAVEVVEAGGTHHLVKVSVGLFDDAAGLVQVSGSGLAAGQHVVVPAL
jgi:hypothetical protein